jgi:hypothetical protein
LLAGISPEVQKAIDIISEEELGRLITIYEQTKMPVGGIIDLEDLPADKNQEFRWLFELGHPLVKQNWSTSSQLRCADFMTGT